MHQSSLELMGGFVRARLSLDGGKVLDVGALNINGCYRGLFGDKWEYTGLDIQAGPNVDLVPSAPYAWYELEDATFDAVISGQCLEHVERDADLVGEMARVLKPGGWCCLIAPSAGFDHGNETMPDLRRYSAETLAALATGAGLVVVESYILPRGPWNDAVVVAQKGLRYSGGILPPGVSVVLQKGEPILGREQAEKMDAKGGLDTIKKINITPISDEERERIKTKIKEAVRATVK